MPAVPAPRLPSGFFLQEGMVGGVVAGTIFGILQTLIAPLLGASLAAPWQAAASVALWRQAVDGPATWGIVLTGIAVHLALSAFFGLQWGAVAKRLPPAFRDDWGMHAGLATGYGVALWVVNVLVIGRLVYPWVLEGNAFVQVLLHGLAYGLPLGLYLTARVRPFDRFFVRAEALARARRDRERPPGA